MSHDFGSRSYWMVHELPFLLALHWLLCLVFGSHLHAAACFIWNVAYFAFGELVHLVVFPRSVLKSLHSNSSPVLPQLLKTYIPIGWNWLDLDDFLSPVLYGLILHYWIWKACLEPCWFEFGLLWLVWLLIFFIIICIEYESSLIWIWMFFFSFFYSSVRKIACIIWSTTNYFPSLSIPQSPLLFPFHNPLFLFPFPCFFPSLTPPFLWLYCGCIVE